jgi:hypothetical protein
MSPLFFVTALALTSPIQAQPDPTAAAPVFKFLPHATLMGTQLECDQTLAKTLGPDGLPLKKLGDLPRALEQHAVLRMVRGCPVLEVVYEGQIYYFQGPVGGMEYDLRPSPAKRLSY